MRLALPLLVAAGLALAAGAASAHPHTPKGAKAHHARAHSAAIPEAPGFHRFQPWKPSKPVSLFGPERRRKR